MFILYTSVCQSLYDSATAVVVQNNRGTPGRSDPADNGLERTKSPSKHE